LNIPRFILSLIKKSSIVTIPRVKKDKKIGKGADLTKKNDMGTFFYEETTPFSICLSFVAFSTYLFWVFFTPEEVLNHS